MIKKGKTEFIGIQFTLKDGSTEFVPTIPGSFKESIENYLNKDMKQNQLLDDRVLIRPSVAEELTASGIFIPGKSKERPMTGQVVLVGPGTKDITMTVKEGDTVLFGKYSGIEVPLEGENLLMMKQEDIFMIIKEKE